MQKDDVNRIYEEFDKTRVFPWTRKKINLTLSVETINKLKELSIKNKKPISRIVDELSR